MRELRGLQKIGQLRESEILIDWNYIQEEHGLRKEGNDVQILLGNLLRFIALLGFAVITVLDLTQGNIILIKALNPTRLNDVIFWVIVGIFCYSLYLLRDRTKFLDTLEVKKISDLKRKFENANLPKSIEITDYFDYDFLNILDDGVRSNPGKFLTFLLIELGKLREIRKLFLRLGLDEKGYAQIVRRVDLEINANKNLWLPKLLFESFVNAYQADLDSVDEKILFFTLAKGVLKDELIKFKILPDDVEGLMLWVQNESKKQRYYSLWRDRASLKPKNSVNRAYTSRYASNLEMYKRDYTLEVITGKFVLSIAREFLLKEIVRLLSQGTKGAVLVIGEPGVGKSTLLKSLALQMVVEDVPDVLKDKRLIGFDFNRAFAVSNSIDNFKKVLEEVLREVSEAKNIVLVMDDFDQLVNIRSEGASEIINLITKAIDEFNIRVIATSSKTGYLSSIKPQKSLVSLFDTLELDEPSGKVAEQIVIDMIPQMERTYGVSVSVDAIKRCVELSQKYAFDRVLPEKAIDLIEEAVVYSKEKGLRFVSTENLEELFSRKVGVNIGTITEEEQIKFEKIEEILHKRVVGQDAAITAIAGALRRSRAGLSSKGRPIASYLFFGPTGVGKTEVAKTLAQAYYGDEKYMIRIDMSEYQENENLKKLIGEQIGDDFSGGFLTEKVREKPFSLILLDEIDKANPKILDLFLQILDEGSVTDGIGRKVDFTNTIIIATSNAGSKYIAELLETGKSYNQVYSEVMPKLRESFRVEFLNRFDKVIMFKPLTQIEIEKIAKISLEKVTKKMYEKSIILEFTPEAVREIATLGYNKVYGARELKRVIEDNVETKLADMIIKKEVTEGRKIFVKSLREFQVI